MNIEPLLQALTEGGPAGLPLLHETEYDLIAAAREEDDPSLPRGVWTSKLKRADWQEAERLCVTALTTRSKDLQIAAWLGEAWIARTGLAGGRDATLLLEQLCVRFWADLHPLPRGQDMDFRTAPFDWADEHWSMALALRVPLWHGRGVDARVLTLADWREAKVLENKEYKDKRAASDAAQRGVLTVAQIAIELASIPLADCQAALDDVHAWEAAVQTLHATLDAVLPGKAPRLRQLLQTLAEAADALQAALRDHPSFGMAPVPAPQAAPAPVADEPEANPQAVVAATASGAIASRADAYLRLQEVADFLARTDPHSPVPALVRRAIDWGRLPFDALLAELTHNNNEMQKLLVRGPRDQ